MSKKYKLAVFIGRFQPIHIGHLSVIREALSLADHLVMILGSCNQARSIKNPWTFEERQEMIIDCLTSKELERVSYRQSEDYFYNEARWLSSIQSIVSCIDPTRTDSEILLVGHTKDDSSYYLKSFPQWNFYECEDNNSLNSTDIRRELFEEKGPFVEFDRAVCSHLLKTYLKGDHSIIRELKAEWEFIENYQASWNTAPYPPTFVTVDGVVVQSGHLLLIQRGGFPGKGLYALPGGFLDQEERIQNAVIRELREETGLKVPEPVLIGSIQDTKVFDHPERSLRGRTITHAFYIKLKDDKDLPRVKGQSDAQKAFWVPFEKLKNIKHKFYEDHYQILNNFLNL